MIGGAIRAKAELLIAPTNEMMGLKFGIQDAKITANEFTTQSIRQIN